MKANHIVKIVKVCRTGIISSMIIISVSPLEMTKKKLFHRILSPHDFQKVCNCFVFVVTLCLYFLSEIDMLAYLMMKFKMFVISLYWVSFRFCFVFLCIFIFLRLACWIAGLLLFAISLNRRHSESKQRLSFKSRRRESEENWRSGQWW